MQTRNLPDSLTDMDLAYANGAFIAGAETYPPRWQAKAAAFRDALGARRGECGLRYGPDERQALDLFLPEGAPKGLLAFIHGGYWLAFGREDWSHLAAGAVRRGWACALPSYSLAPAARVSEMTAEIARALHVAAARLPGVPLVVTGHSAGGHLAARMGCDDQPLPVVRRVVPISPLAELAPLMATEMNDSLCLDPAECAAESPARMSLRPGCTAHVVVGGQERPAFLWQARLLSEHWACPWTVMPDRHHFDVIDDLEDPDSALCDLVLGAL